MKCHPWDFFLKFFITVQFWLKFGQTQQALYVKTDGWVYDWSSLLRQTVFSVSYEFETYERVDDVNISPLLDMDRKYISKFTRNKA